MCLIEFKIGKENGRKMNQLISYFNEINILTHEKLEDFIFSSELNVLINFAIEVRQIVEEDFNYNEYTPFSFVPSTELSGAGGCREVNCKIRRAEDFSIFSGLYADNVYLTLNFLTALHFDTDIEMIYFYEDDFRYMLWCDFSIILVNAELIKRGIVQIVPTQKNVCPDCFQKQLLGLPNPVDLSALKNHYIDNAQLIVNNYDKNEDRIQIAFENMSDFFPLHTESMTFENDILDLLPKKERKINKIIKNLKFKTAVINELLDSEFSDVCLYSLCCKNMDSKFITTKPSDAMFLEMTQQRNNRISTIENLPLYDLPIISSIPMNTILKLREVENDSFNRYRIALNRAIKENYNSKNKKQIKEVYDDILYPAFQNLDERLRNIKTGMFRKTFSTIMVVGSVISAGLYTGIIPPNAQEIFLTLGGTSALTKFGMDKIKSLIEEKEQIRENDFYFLWRLKNKKFSLKTQRSNNSKSPKAYWLSGRPATFTASFEADWKHNVQKYIEAEITGTVLLNLNLELHRII